MSPLLDKLRRDLLGEKEPARAATRVIRLLTLGTPSALILGIWSDWTRLNQPLTVNRRAKGAFDTACDMVNEAVARARKIEKAERDSLDAAGFVQRRPVLELAPVVRRDWIDDARIPRGDMSAYDVAVVKVDEAWQACGADIARSICAGVSVWPPWWKDTRRNTLPGSLDFGVPPDVSDRRMQSALVRWEGGPLRQVFDYLTAAPLLLTSDRTEMEESVRQFLRASEANTGFWDAQLTDAPLLLAQRLLESASRREGRPARYYAVTAICSEVRALATGSYMDTVENCICDAQVELTVVVDVAARAWLRRFRASAEEYASLAKCTSEGNRVMSSLALIRDRLGDVWHVVAR
ncbi:hypothetical protein [Falsiroseomonas sp. E2-1-a20]|uniref:hypothetical protein n=1 Tax=Falsiroseomonas sp. E2-1-a20 TaxID=3239300 RepID=UPI003F4162BC